MYIHIYVDIYTYIYVYSNTYAYRVKRTTKKSDILHICIYEKFSILTGVGRKGFGLRHLGEGSNT